MRFVAGKSEAAELCAYLPRFCLRQQPLHVLKRRLAGDQLLDLMLGEIADAQLAARHERTTHRLELPGEKTRERGLAVAVAADQCDAVVRIDAHIEKRQHPRRPP